ncbi:MAG TPA: hypothetical protein VFU05_09860 [Cyclobacteriaceae bacterium]|nr:hypothetical protein [Cyclobacteriaceae bacterium]
MHLKFLIVIPLLVLALSARSQELPPFKRIIKLYPIQLYKVFPTATIAYEHRVAYNLSVTLEAATYLDLSIVNADYSDKRGIRFREELRYYFKYRYSKSNPTYARGTYSAVDLQQTSATYSKDAQNFRWKEAGFGFKFGMAEYLNRITLDYSIGVAFRYADETPPDLWASMINFWEDRNPIVQPTLSLGVGYRF